MTPYVQRLPGKSCSTTIPQADDRTKRTKDHRPWRLSANRHTTFWNLVKSLSGVNLWPKAADIRRTNLIVGILVLCFMLYLELFRKTIWSVKAVCRYFRLELYSIGVITALMVTNNVFNVYILPYAMLPINHPGFSLIHGTAFDICHHHTDLFHHPAILYEFIILTQLAAGLVAIFSLRELSAAHNCSAPPLVILLTYAAIYSGFWTDQRNDLQAECQYVHISSSMECYYCLLILYSCSKRLLVFTSNVTLVELSNINNNDLPRRMSETNSWYFQHSMVGG